MVKGTRALRITEANRRWWVLGAMCCALFMTMLDNTSVYVALSTIQRSLHATTVMLQWIVSAYTLALAVLLVTGGRMGDLFGRRRYFLIGTAIFAVASGAIGFAPNVTWVVIWRVIQGAGAALLVPATLSIITNTFPPEERGKAIGAWTGISGLALALGPAVGGLLVQEVGWRAIFFINIPIAAGASVAALLTVRESRDETVTEKVDVPGLVTLTAGLTALMLAIVESARWHLGSTIDNVMFALAAVSLASFVAIELRSRSPMVDFRFFSSRTFRGTLIVTFIDGFVLFGALFFVSLYIQNVRGYSALQAGLRFLPSMVVLVAVSPIAGRLADRVGSRPLIVAGMLSLTGSLFWVSHGTIHSGYWMLLGSAVLLGLGVGLILPPTSTAAMNAVEQSRAGVASGMLAMARMVGGAIGIASLGTYMLAQSSKELNRLMPWLPPGASRQMVNNPPNPKALELAPTELLLNVRRAFLGAYQSTMRVGAAVPLAGALLAFMLIAGRRSQKAASVVQASAAQTSAASTE
jgi:EmrB/QacA subfamily drug resistance transporter